MIDSTFQAASAAHETDQELLHLLAIAHDDLAATIRLVDSARDIVSNGDTYTASNFTIKLPDDLENKIPNVDFQIDNVDRAISEAMETMDKEKDCTITLSVILADSPNVVQRGPFSFTLKSCKVNAFWATGTMAYEDIMNEKYPKDDINPNLFPGLF